MPAIGASCRLVNVSPRIREPSAASSWNISKKSPSRKSSSVPAGRPRLTSKYCCIIGVGRSEGMAGKGAEVNVRVKVKVEEVRVVVEVSGGSE